MVLSPIRHILCLKIYLAHNIIFLFILFTFSRYNTIKSNHFCQQNILLTLFPLQEIRNTGSGNLFPQGIVPPSLWNLILLLKEQNRLKDLKVLNMAQRLGKEMGRSLDEKSTEFDDSEDM